MRGRKNLPMNLIPVPAWAALTPRQWRTMSVDQMLHHLNLAGGGSLGSYDLPNESNLATRTVGQWVTVDWLPEQPVDLRLSKGFKIRMRRDLSSPPRRHNC